MLDVAVGVHILRGTCSVWRIIRLLVDGGVWVIGQLATTLDFD